VPGKRGLFVVVLPVWTHRQHDHSTNPSFRLMWARAAAGRFFVPDSCADGVTRHWCVEAADPPGCLRVVSFAKGETDEGLDVA